ncbi:MAG TPA: methyltransferase, partial [Planctomycetota bacterium]|nr:methyltransferase [Planctomycetota bacterium]
PWKEHKTFCDLGCAQGMVPVVLGETHAHLHGTGFDLPEVGPIFEEFVTARKLSKRLHFKAGNFFNDPLPKAEVYIMGHILHDWNLEKKNLLIKKCYDALPAGGALIAYDTIIDDERRQNAFGLLMSLNMLIETLDGFDYTGADCIGWMKQAGFKKTQLHHLVGPESMVIGFK